MAEPAPASGLRGEVIAPDGVTGTGRLALTWWTAAEAQQGLSTATMRTMLERMTVSPTDADLEKTPRIPYALPGAPADAVPVAVFDVEHTFWATLAGHGKGMFGKGVPGGGPLHLIANETRGPPKERCEGDRYKLLVIEHPQLGKRRFCAYLPASWKTAPKRRYPLVMLLPGFGSTDVTYLVGRDHGGERLDALTKATGLEAVLVGVDTSTPLGSTYLEDSSTMGPWDTFLAKEALPVLDRELRILPGPTAHGLMGHSTGGYNSLSFGMRHSQLFGAIGVSSPDAPDVDAWLFCPGRVA